MVLILPVNPLAMTTEVRKEMITKAMAREPQRGRLTTIAILIGILLGALMITTNAYGVSTIKSQPASTSHSGIPSHRNVLGATDAPVEIVIYNDLQCIYCSRLHTGAEAQIIDQYVRQGKARLEVRQYPTYGEESLRAAEAVLAAADQGKYWEYRDLLFRNLKGVNKGNFSDENLIRWAGEVGLDQATFTNVLTSNLHRNEVERELQEAEKLGVDSVPTVFINGRKVEATESFATFQQIIEKELAK
jgi:protein-disulfide isomerase